MYVYSVLKLAREKIYIFTKEGNEEVGKRKSHAHTNRNRKGFLAEHYKQVRSGQQYEKNSSITQSHRASASHPNGKKKLKKKKSE